MNILLDTNSLIWFADNSPKLGKTTRRLIEEADQCYVSVASVLEITIKMINGKLKIPTSIDEQVQKLAGGYLDIKARHAEAVVRFPSLVKHDPFDRLLLAQADIEGLTLLTSDKTLLNLGLDYLVDARE